MLKRLYNSLCLEMKLLKKYLYENRWYILFSSILVLYIYSTWLFNNDLRVDAEKFINEPYSTYGLWSARPGKFLTSFLFGVRWFNPYLCTGFGYVLLCVSGIFCGYLFYRMGNVNKILCASIIPFIYCYPIMVTQFYFNIQVFEMAWAYLVCYIAAAWAFYSIYHKNFVGDIISIMCMIWAFSTYQTFIVLYIALVVGCYILCNVRWIVERKNVSVKQALRIIVKLIVNFAVAFIGYWYLTTFWFSKDLAYLNSQVFWGKGDVFQGLKNIIDHISEGFLGDGEFYTVYYGIFSLGAVIVSIWKCIKERYNLSVILILSVVFLQLCPFLLTIYMGQEPAKRTQLAYSFVLAFDIILVIHITWKKCCLRWIVSGIAISCLWVSSGVTLRLIYTQSISVQEDKQILAQVSSRIYDTEKPIAFIGSRKNELNEACLRADIIGVSIFEHDKSAEPHYYYSSERACDLARTMGYSFVTASSEQISEARKIALDMEVWPAEDSIRDVGEFIIVKLGEDEWGEEVLEGNLEEIEAIKECNENDTIRYTVDGILNKDGKLMISGWIVKENCSSLNNKMDVYLKNENTMQYYKVGAVKDLREDVSSAFGKKGLYDWSGYVGLVSISELQDDSSSYTVILGYYDTLNNEESFINTGTKLSAIG